MPRKWPQGRNNRKPAFKPRPKEKTVEWKHENQLKEVEVGITQFISRCEGFSGIIKARFSDFQVNEIDLDGKLAKLTDQAIPKDFQKKGEVAEEAPEEPPLSQIPQDTWNGIKNLMKKENKNEEVHLDASEIPKEERGAIHECLRKYFGNKILGNTVHKDDGKTVTVFKRFDGKGDGRLMWPKDKGEYVHFLVYKECLDTLETTLKLANCVRVPASNFAYAGVKDRRAKTTQWFSVRKVEPWKLIIKTKCLRNIKVGNITFKDKPLKLGDLSGNRFRIALRNVTVTDCQIDEALTSVRDKGFINYYGLQRFGNDKAVPTFDIGVKLLTGQWKEACDIILKVTESDRPDLDITKAKKLYEESRDASKALLEFSDNQKTSIEYLLLEGLSKGHENDYVNALTSIPRNTRLLYLHSFQSLIWNLVVSKRIELYGLEVVEGDLIIEEIECDEESKRPKVRALTSHELSQFSIYDIVLPLPGFDVTYPKNLEDFYQETLQSYGLDLEMTQQKVKEYSLSGTYRKLLGQVKDLNWKVMHYDDPNHNLIQSDFEELKKWEEPIDVIGGAYKALVLDFSLDSACYATMVLREILKTDTSCSSNAKLNNYHLEKKEVEISEMCGEKVGLLGDEKKYEAFKNLVFGDEPSLKRKMESDDTPVKHAKTDS